MLRQISSKGLIWLVVPTQFDLWRAVALVDNLVLLSFVALLANLPLLLSASPPIP